MVSPLDIPVVRRRNPKSSAQAMTRNFLERHGFFVEAGERRVPGVANVSRDSFGWIDLWAVNPHNGQVIGVQASTAIGGHITKMRAWRGMRVWLISNKAQMWLWRRSKQGWQYRILNLVLNQDNEIELVRGEWTNP